MSMKAERKAIMKSGAKRLIGAVSAWAAHKQKLCFSGCHYCKR